MEFTSVYKEIPKNEQILRSIDRELQIKEALFLLRLQKKEEASINFAVVRPSIKIIDSAMVNPVPVSPDLYSNLFISILLGLAFPFIVITIMDILDKFKRP